MDRIGNFGIIKYRYENEVTQYMKDFLITDDFFYGIYFKRNNKLYGISFSFYSTETVYFLDKIFLISELFSLVKQVYFYPLENPEFLCACDHIIYKVFCLDSELVNFNFGQKVIETIMENANSTKENNIETRNIFSFYFDKIERIIRETKETYGTEDPLHFLKDHPIQLENEIILFSKKINSYHHKQEKKKIFVKLHKYYWSDQPLYLLFTSNFLLNHQYDPPQILDTKIKSNEMMKEMEEIQKNIQSNYLTSQKLNTFFEKITQFCYPFVHSEYKPIDQEIYPQIQKIEIPTMEGYDIFPLCNGGEVVYFTKNPNDIDTFEKKKELLQYYNLLHKQDPHNLYLIYLQNCLIDELSLISIEGD